MFDIACPLIWEQVKYTSWSSGQSKSPTVFYLLSVDSPEMKIHTFNRFEPPTLSIGWDTTVGQVCGLVNHKDGNALFDVLLVQHNRK